MKSTKSVFGILTIMAALALQVQAQSFLTNGLVAYYPFTGNANDASGNGRNGTVIGATSCSNRFESPNSAYAFDGVADFIGVSDFPEADTSTHTISVWIRANMWANIPNTEPHVDIIDKYTSGTGGQRQWVFQGNRTGQIRSAIYTSTGEHFFDSTAHLLTNIWYHLVQVWDGTNDSLFINGVVDSSIPAPGTLVPSSAPIRIGGNPADSQQMFCGNIDDLRFYNRALSSNEVAQLYAIESGPRVDLIKAVKPSFSNLSLGSNYQLQVSTDMNTWTNQGSAFTATNTSMVYPQYWDLDNWNQLFFRLQVAP